MVLQTLLLALLTLTASLVGTISGFGISTIMIPVLSLFYPLPLTLIFVAVIHLFGDLWKVIFFRKGVNWKLVLGFGVPGVAASYLGASLSLSAPEALLKQFLGGFLLVYGVFLFVRRSWKVPRSNATAVSGGALSGFFAGIFGVGGAVRSAFLAAYDLPKEMFIFTSGMIALFIDTTRIYQYIAGGTRIPRDMALTLVILIPLSLGGAYVAKRIVHKVPQNLFRLIIASFLGLVALKFIFLP